MASVLITAFSELRSASLNAIVRSRLPSNSNPNFTLSGSRRGSPRNRLPGPSAKIQARRREIQNFQARTVRPDFNYSHWSPSETTEPVQIRLILAYGCHPPFTVHARTFFRMSENDVFRCIPTREAIFLQSQKAKGAFVSESALHNFDGDKPNSVGPRKISGPDDHSSHPSRTRDECPANFHSPWCDDTRGLAGRLPFLCLSCTAWGFSCLANCSASGELLPPLFTLACAFLKEPAVSFL